MKRAVVVLCLTLVAVWGCQPPDCDRPDCGTCAHPCCRLKFVFAGNTSEEVYKRIMASMEEGGADGRYTLVGGFDYRKFKQDGLDFMVQGLHTTLKHKYNDTMNFVLGLDKPNGTKVEAFSISQIAGAYCDAGQNYKNLVGFVKGLDMAGFTEETVFGCPKPQ